MADPTVLSIADTAVKIGLGALISGFATYWVTRQKQVMDLRKDALSERRAVIKQIVLDIARTEEVTHQYTHCARQSVISQRSEAEDNGVKSKSQKVLDDLWDLRGNVTKISAHVRLLGDDQAIDLWEMYRGSRSRLLERCFKAEAEDKISYLNDGEWDEIIKDGNKAYDKLCRHLSRLHFA